MHSCCAFQQALVKIQTLNQTVASRSTAVINTERAHCKFCPPSNDNKANILCSNFKKYICKSHVKLFGPEYMKFYCSQVLLLF